MEFFLFMTIALLTDFGTQDYFVGAMKGAILSVCETAQIVDITHDIAAQNIRTASFVLRACYRDFPKKTIFVAVVDPGVGSNRRAILVETEDFYFIAPDNGLLSFVFLESKELRIFEITNDDFFKHPVSRTFHGRDVFAPVAAHLAGGVKPGEFGNQIADYVSFAENAPRRISDDRIEAEIIHTDHFGNLILNVRKSDLPFEFAVEINGKNIRKQQTFFAEAEKGELFMIWGSAGFLEIVAFQDSAKKLLNAETGSSIKVEKL